MTRFREHIYVIIPFYNVGDWIGRCIESVAKQELNSEYLFRVHVVDDASTDHSGDMAKRLCIKYGYNYHRNDQNQKCPKNIFEAIGRSGARDWDPIFLLDGDDYLPHLRVLNRVSQLFAEEDTWLTYGQYMSDPPNHGCTPARAFNHDTIKGRHFRKVTADSQYFNHPLVFRKFLFDAIPLQHFKNRRGKWFETSYDRVLMVPMLELATGWDSETRWKFINEILYAYNSVNDNSEASVVPDANVDDLYLRSPLPPYSRRIRRG